MNKKEYENIIKYAVSMFNETLERCFEDNEPEIAFRRFKKKMNKYKPEEV